MYKNKNGILRILFLTIIFFILAGLYLLSDCDFITLKNQFIIISVMLLIYLLGEIYLLYLEQGMIAVITPAAITSVTHFFLAFCLSNILLINGDHYTSTLYTYEYLIKAQYLAIFSSMLFWIGYKSKIGSSIAILMNNIKLIKRLYTFNNNINIKNVFVIFLVATACQFIGLKLGITGYADISQLNNSIAYSSFSEYITILIRLSSIMFGALAIEVYSDVNNKKMKVYMNILFITLIIIGFMMGMKGSVLMPIINLIIAKLLVQKKINFKVIIIGIIVLSIAYSVIGNYREILRSTNSSLSRIEALQLAITLNKGIYLKQNLTDDVLDRFNETKDFAASMYYKDHNELGEDDPQFLTHILVAPFSAIIPRKIWASKPMSTYGLWYSRVVYGMPAEVYSSTKMSIESFLYFAGGKIGVLLGMFIIGILMKFIFEFLKPKNNFTKGFSKSHYLLYLNFIPLFMYLDTPTDFISNLIRYFFIYALFIKIIYKKSKPIYKLF